MPSFNKVIIMGNLTRDPELRVTPKGTSVCQLGMAINSSYKDKDGNLKEEVTFVDVDSFGKQAEVIAKYCKKGRPLLIEGRLKLDTWEDKDGGKRSKLKVILDSFTFVGGREESREETSAPQAAPFREKTPAAARAEVIDEKDVPF
jgi:single-strand DNA-binding protein